LLLCVEEVCEVFVWGELVVLELSYAFACGVVLFGGFVVGDLACVAVFFVDVFGYVHGCVSIHL